MSWVVVVQLKAKDSPVGTVELKGRCLDCGTVCSIYTCTGPYQSPCPALCVNLESQERKVLMIPVCIQCNQKRAEGQGWGFCFNSAFTCGVILLPRFSFLWTVSRDYRACFFSPLLSRVQREGPSKAWIGFQI